AASVGYDAVHSAFNFQADGSVPDDVNAQTSAQARATSAGARSNLDYFQSTIGTISNVDQLIADTKLTSFMKSVYQLPADISDADLKNILIDPSFAAAQGFGNVNAAFSFAADGSAAAGSGPQSAEQLMNTTDSYSVRYDDAQQEAIDAAV